MTCYEPLTAWEEEGKTPRGKRVLNFSETSKSLKPIKIACGQCLGCRLDYSRAWAVRCVKEAELHDENCFITLTYDDENLPEGPTLIKRDFQLFMKKLRKEISPQRVRFYMCGEYGEKYGRPHYHAVLFGYDFPDKEPIGRSNQYGKNLDQLYSSAMLQNIWKKGFVSVGAVTFESAAYVARYVMKKVTGEKADQHYKKIGTDNQTIIDAIPEYTTCSRRPGIAADWFEQYGKNECYPSDTITYRKGQKIVEVKIPKYFDTLFELYSPTEMEEVKNKRVEKAKKYSKDTTPERLNVRQKVKAAQIRDLKRNKLEDINR